jgi:DNA polymerase-3 subunit alpha
VASILSARAADGPFRSLTDFCCRVDLRLNNRKVIEALIKSGSFDSLRRTRASLLQGLDRAVDIAAADREAKSSSQSLLFDEPAESHPPDRFEDLPEWSADEKIRYEKETLGFYITGHPLARFEEEIRLFGDVTAETAREKVDQPIRLVGLVGAVKKNQIRKGQNEGKMMAKAILEDLTGSVPVTVFASLLERIGSWFAPGRAVLVTGIVRSSMTPGIGEPVEAEGAAVPVEIIARDIQPLEGLREQSAREVLLVAAIPETLDETFASVKELLQTSPGNVPVFLELRRSGQFEARVRLDGRYAVKPTPDLTAGLEELLGPKSVRYGYAPTP